MQMFQNQLTDTGASQNLGPVKNRNLTPCQELYIANQKACRPGFSGEITPVTENIVLPSTKDSDKTKRTVS